MSPAHVDENWQCLEEATALAARVADPAVIGRVLTAKGMSHRLCGELGAASATFRQALPLLAGGSMWGSRGLCQPNGVGRSLQGPVASALQLLPELEAAARRAGHHGALYLQAMCFDLVEASGPMTLAGGVKQNREP